MSFELRFRQISPASSRESLFEAPHQKLPNPVLAFQVVLKPGERKR